MSFFQKIHKFGFGNIQGDVLSGLVVALALIPEAIAFSIIAGVDPKVGLYASFCISIIIAFAGGRPAMISAATGAMALVMASLVKDYGLQYLLATTILTGVIQITAGFFKLGNLMRFVSRSVMIGFVNALAILIFTAQLPELIHMPWYVYAMTASGLIIIYLFPYLPVIGKILPSPLVCILVLSAFSVMVDVDVRTVGDMGKLPDTLPIFLLPDVPLNLHTFWVILPYSLSLAAVGLLESLMTAKIVDNMTNTTSDRNRECTGQGIANIGAGLLGGMAGCAMIGQSVINVKSGGRTRLSTLLAGVFLLILVVFLGDFIKIIPMPALVSVMIMVSISTFSWQSLKDLGKHPTSTNLVMLTTVAIVVYTHNLALGVFGGVLLASLFFANKIGHLMTVTKETNPVGDSYHYRVIGQVFFACAERFIAELDPVVQAKTIIIDLQDAHFWDITALSALEQVIINYQNHGAMVQVIGVSQTTKSVVDKFGIQNSLKKST